ncbi:hypothetical protein H4R34_003664 [Dimargaris verticillata]|uniref:Uncharacterized protein n=1 Tax=Dimargaris verticillata TaxID=2761393 RepID=A0A9W8B0E3_9FUNG|nr:hypothetical protein H4R34_003664 [Dimargaris verticillata]
MSFVENGTVPSRLAAETTSTIFNRQSFDAAGKILSQPFMLSANSNREECITLKVPSFCQYQATLTLHFNNPATQRPLQSTHSFGVYLLFQCLRHVSNPLSQAPVEDTRIPDAFIRVESLTCHALLFRELFHVAPVDGISLQSVGYITHKPLQIALAVKQISENNELVLDVLRDTRNDAENADGPGITTLMIQELCQMNRMYTTA